MKVFDEELVISGVSGRFPLSPSVNEFAENLLRGVDMVTEDEKRWPLGLFDLPRRHGKLDDIDKFDAQFFGVSGRQADHMDPQLRMLHEVAYEAICDSGLIPATIRGRSIGVFVSSAWTDAKDAFFADHDISTKYALPGTTGAMMSNRISFALDLKGPSLTIDTACASSLSALDQAFHAIRSGQCEAALVGGVNLCLNPGISVKYNSMSMLSPDGECRAFDADANGFVRSEACSIIFIQKVSDAKRIYARIINSRSNSDGYTAEGITFPSSEMQRQLIKKTYEECNIDPLTVNFVETHGTGTKVGDPAEVNAIASIFCPGRKVPLLLGATKSNMGHAEFAAGLCGLVKVLIACERGVIPANLHLKAINKNIESLVNGTVMPVTENTNFKGGLIGINSFGMGGANVHMVIRSHDKEKKFESHDVIPSTHPRLVVISGRTKEAVTTGLNFIKSKPTEVTREFLALLTDLSKSEPESGMEGRGFTLLNNQASEANVSRVAEKRPLWFIIPGMGAQWTAMGRDLLHLPQFAASIDEFARIIKEKDVDLIHLLTSDDTELIKNPVNLLVMCAAVQGALIDLLYSLGVKADGIIGHSQGEVGCAYADGCLNKRQFILSVYWGAESCLQAELRGGLMAAVALSVDECEKRMPQDISIACHNSPKSLTLAGPEESIRAFIKKLSSESIFAREVHSCGIALHTSHTSKAAGGLLRELSKEITSPVKRSPKWISSSVPESEWSNTESQYASAEYITNNSISRVLFADAVKHIPKDAILLEIAPHPLFKTALHQSLGGDATHACLMNKNKGNQVTHLFESLGQLYNLGVNLNLEVLYPPVDYPVPRGTPSISSLMRWDHSQSWLVPKYPEYFNPSKATGDIETTVDLSTEDDAYLAGHMIDGRVLFPATAYVMLAWRAFSLVRNEVWSKFPVKVSNFQLQRACVLPKSGPVVFSTQVLSSTGDFSITEGGVLVARGHIAALSPSETNSPSVTVNTADDNDLRLTKHDVYKEFRLRGYDYGPSFQCVERSTFDGSRAVQRWTGEWVSFADALAQISILSMKDRDLNLPVRINSIECDPTILSSLEPGSLVDVRFDADTRTITGGGLKIKMPSFSLVSRTKAPAYHENYLFIPHFEENVECREVEDYISMCSSVASAILSKAHKRSEASSLSCDAKTCIESIDDIYRSVKDDKRQILLKCLSELYTVYDINENNLEQNLASVLKKYHDELTDDLLQQSFTSERVLRPMVNLVIENTASKQSMNILEVNSTGSLFAESVTHFTSLKDRVVYFSLLGNSEENLNNVNVLKLQKSESLNLPPQDLVLYHHSLETAEARKQDKLFAVVCSYVSEGGFLLLGGRTSLTRVEKVILSLDDRESLFDELITEAQITGFTVVARRSNRAGGSLVLLRKRKEQTPGQDSTSIIGVNSSQFSWVEELKQAMADRETNPAKGNIWLINTDGPRSGLLGLVNCLRLEPGGDKIRCILDKGERSIDDAKSYVIDDKVLNLDLAVNVIDENNQPGSYCHLDSSMMSKMVPCEHAFLQPLTRGDVSSLTWIESDCKFARSDELPHGSQLVHIYYSALNLRDLILVTEKLELASSFSQSNIGVEVAGRLTTGERVFGFIAGAGIATTCIMDNTLMWSVPDEWSLEEAATVPVAYSTAYYALCVRGSLQSGESVLIHSGAGALGLAAISICLSMSCQVLVTVGTPAKKKYLLEEFPELKEENIFNSRDLIFEQGVMKATRGRGVDAVLNSLAEDKLEASVGLLARYGRFLEVGKYDMMKDSAPEMPILISNVSFLGVCLAQLFSSDPSESCERHKKMVKRLVDEGIANGTVRPLRRTVFTSEKAEDAFCSMSTGEHIGKILIEIRQEEQDKSHRPETKKMLAMSRTYFISNKSYIIIGGSGGFGLEFAYWMATRGARNLILTPLSGEKDAHQTYCLDRLEKMGARVILTTVDAGDLHATNELVDEAIALGPVGGIFNLALVLRDKLFVNQTEESFREVTHCKVAATINLDTISRVKCPQLDHFVVFSSIACGYGSAGQSNYGLANSVMERICEERRKLNLPALAIQWGAIADVGVISDEMSSNTEIAGTVPQMIHSCLSELDEMLVSRETIVTSVVRSSRETNSKATDTSVASAGEVLSIVCRILGVSDPLSISPTTTLQELGMDSLMRVEIKQALDRECNTTMSTADISSLTFAQLLSISRKNVTIKSDCVSKNDRSLDSKATASASNRVQASPLDVLLETEGGARSLFCLVSSLFIVITIMEELRYFYDEEERAKRNNFWTGQLSSWPFFLYTWLCMHVVLCAVVYPAGQFMQEKSNKLCFMISFTSIILIKCILFQLYRQFTLRGAAPSATAGMLIAAESSRLSMKLTSYLAECRSSNVRSEVTLGRFIYFLFAPSLIYRNNYARTEGKINWWQAFKYFFGFALLTYMLALWIKNFSNPMVQMIHFHHENASPLSRAQLINFYLILSVTAMLFMQWLGFAVVHYFLNALAEVLRYSDRQFYKNWWTTRSAGEMMRSWNFLVHQWLDRYVFCGLIDQFGKLTAITAVFIISGLGHDFLAALAFGFFVPAHTIQMILAGGVTILERPYQILHSKFPNFLSHNLMCYYTLLHLGLIFSLYTFEVQSRTLCPHLYGSDVSDFIAIRFHHCIKF